MTVSRSTSFAAGLAVAFVAFGSIVWGEPPVAEVPDDRVTPGVVAEDGTSAAEVCAIRGGLSYSKRHRATPSALKTMIRNRDHAIGRGEVDHRCPLALGCADVVYNLWWQPGDDTDATWTYKDKDALEVWAWEGVCKRGDLSLKDAQGMFLAPADWRQSYCSVFQDGRCEGLK